MAWLALLVQLCVLIVCGAGADPLPGPSAQQVAWLEKEIGVIFHYTMYTFVSEPNPLNHHQDCSQVFNPNLKEMPNQTTFFPTSNTTFVDQWMETAIAFGAKYVILVVKHCDGFVSYPTNYTFRDGTPYGYSIQNSNWRDSKGDLAREFVDSARKYGLAPGFYYNLNGNFYLAVENGVPVKKTTEGQHPVSRDEYYELVLSMLRDLWSNYGELSEIWFDSGTPFNKNGTFQHTVAQLAAELQPNTILLQGPSAVNGARKGNGETGTVHNPNWYQCENTMACRGGKLGGQGPFIPAEGEGCAVGNGNSRQWFWHPDHDEHAKQKTLGMFWNEYHASVGLGSNYLIGFTPDREGLIPADDVTKLTAFGDLVKSCYGTPLARVGPGVLANTSSVLEVELTGTADRVWLLEDISQGQRIHSFVILHKSQAGAVVVAAKGESMGRKRIVRLNQKYDGGTLMVKVSAGVHWPITLNEVAAFSPCQDP